MQVFAMRLHAQPAPGQHTNNLRWRDQIQLKGALAATALPMRSRSRSSAHAGACNMTSKLLSAAPVAAPTHPKPTPRTPGLLTGEGPALGHRPRMRRRRLPTRPPSAASRSPAPASATSPAPFPPAPTWWKRPSGARAGSPSTAASAPLELALLQAGTNCNAAACAQADWSASLPHCAPRMAWHRRTSHAG